MREYLLVYKGHAKFFTYDFGNGYEDFVDIVHDFEEKHGKEKFEWADFFSIWPHQVECGVLYDEELSYNGARFLLFKLPGVTKEQINKTKRELRYKHDVAGIRVLDIKDYEGSIPGSVEDSLLFGRG